MISQHSGIEGSFPARVRHALFYAVLLLVCGMFSAAVIACEQTSPTATAVATPTATATSISDATDTPVPQSLVEVAPKLTEIPTVSPTPVLTDTPTPEPTETLTPTPTPTETATPEPTNTSTPVPTHTATPEPTVTPTPTRIPTEAPTPAPTDTPVPTPTYTATATPSPASKDRDALVKFYEAMNGAEWRNQSNWLSDEPLGEWHGVTTDDEGRVTELVINENGLSGSLPAEMVDLTELMVLELERNEISGGLPSWIADMSKLRVVDLDENDLSDPLPRELSTLVELEVLSLFSNRLNGEIPAELGHLTNLIVLDLGSNDLIGEIPVQLGELRELRILRLEDNRMEGELPSVIGNLHHLEELVLSGNRLSGPLTSEIKNLKSVKWLRLQFNRFSGAIPDELSELSKLIELDLSNNLLSGSIPEWLGEFEGLAALHIAGNAGLSGCLPEGLSEVENNDFEQTGLVTCKDEDVQRSALVALYNATDGPNWTDNTNWLSDAPLGEWYGVTTDELGSVTELQLTEAGLIGEIPPELGTLSRLIELRLDGNELRGQIPTELGDLAALERLILYENQLTGNIPVNLGNLSNLELLVLANNLLDGEIPSELSGLSRVDGIYLQENQLVGAIPSELWGLPKLTHLRLGQNRLTVEFPQEVADLSNFKMLLVANNDQFIGCIPDILHGVESNDFAELDIRFCGDIAPRTNSQTDRVALVALYESTNGAEWANSSNWLSDTPLRTWHGVTTDGQGRVTHIELEHNDLSGEIPPELGELSALKVLDLGHNEIRGRIPVELSNLPKLRVLTLDDNRLRGSVPPELGDLGELVNLRLDFNRLSGSLPPELGKLSKLENFEILENNLSGEIPDEIGSLPRLRQFFVSRNYAISGCIPDGVLDIKTTDLNHVDLPSCSEFERDVLAKLYEATEGVNWTNGEGWLTDAPLDDWYGIDANEFGRVVAVDLTSNNLSGEIPNALGRLLKLNAVYLSGNGITGCMPLSIVDLPTNEFDDWALRECGVHFPDYWLKTAMMERLGKEPGSEIYASDLASLESLDLSWSAIRDLEGLQYATNLKSLTLGVSRATPRPNEDSYHNLIQNLAPVSQLLNLSELKLARCQLTDISALSTLTDLEYLDIGFNRLHHIGSLSNLHKLESLLMSGNHVDDIADLTDAANLILLDVSDNKLTEIAPISGLDRLLELDISYNEVVDLAPVSGLEQLEILEMKGIKTVDLSPIERLQRLTYLDASWIDVVDLSPLKGLAGLRTLKIGPAFVSDVSVISGLEDLEELRIVGTGLTDLSPLSDLRNLRSLGLSDNRITELSPLAGLNELEFLDLNFNGIEDVSPVVGLTNLKDLRLNGNQVLDIEPLIENRGLGDSDRVELDDEVQKDIDNRGLAKRLTDRGVVVEFGKLRATAFGQPQIHHDNLVILPISKSVKGGNLRLEDTAKEFYEIFEDEFDFLMVLSNIELGDNPFKQYSGSYFAVSNEVEGIGIEKFHNDGWGSEARLQGVLDLPWKHAIGSGPVLHELMHRWGNSIFTVEPGGHWGWSSIYGQLGGFDIDELVDLGGGRYSAGGFGPGGFAGDFLPYAALELYIAGLGSAEEVPDWITGVDAWFSFTEDGRVEEHEDGEHVFTVKEFKTYTIDDIIAMHGPRVPDYATSQKEFRAAAILLIDEDHPATTEVVDEISRHVARFGHPGDDDEWQFNFYEATRGRGTMLMGDLSEFLKDSDSE